MNAITIKDLTVSYDLKPVIWDVDLEIKKGSLMAIVGPNGAGKSTLIKALLGIVKPVTGTVLFLGEPYQKMRKKISYVPQRESVDWDFPTTVFDVVLMGRYGHIGWVKRPSKNDKKLALEALKKVKMENYKDRHIKELSGGQQQRVFLARSLVQDAEIYLMDEPFQGVDVKTEKAIIKILKQLETDNKTVIVVHHDLDTVKDYFSTVTLLNKQIIKTGKVSEVFTEENIRLTYEESKLIEGDK